MAPTPELNASVSMWKGTEKSGKANTGTDDNACFKAQKAES
jgi:hypothetical protein